MNDHVHPGSQPPFYRNGGSFCMMTNPYVIKQSETRRSPTHKKWCPVGLPGCTQKTTTSFSLPRSRKKSSIQGFVRDIVDMQRVQALEALLPERGVGGKMAEDVSNGDT